MTTPVLMDYQNMENGIMHENSNTYMSMRFYIPQAYQANTPIPTDGSVQIITEPEMIVATYHFLTNYQVGMPEYIYHRDLLIQMLGDQAKYYDLHNMITAGYDSPMVTVGRRNEVMLKKKTN